MARKKKIFKDIDLETDSSDLDEFEEIFDAKKLSAEAPAAAKLLDEDELPEAPQLVDYTPQKRAKGKRWAAPFGLLMLFLSIVGIVTTVNFCVNTIHGWTNNEAEMAEYEKLLESVVMFDPDPFDDISKADPEFLLESAIWTAVSVDASPGQYSTDENGRQIVPVDVVEESFQHLYGTDVKPEHNSFNGYAFDVEYSAVSNAYFVPSTGVSPIYYPHIVSMSKRGDSIVLKVGYISQGQFVEKNGTAYTLPEPAKYMSITLRTRDDAQYISTIQVDEA